MAITPIPIAEIARQIVDVTFGLYAEVAVAATYKRAEGEPPVVTHSVPVTCLVMLVDVGSVDGTTIEPGDDLIWIRASELASVPEPQPGDYLIETGSGLRRDIVVAQEDLGFRVWRFHARKVYE